MRKRVCLPVKYSWSAETSMMLAKLLKASLSFMTIQRSLRVRWTKPRWRSDRQAKPTKQTASRASCANVIPITSVADRSARFQFVARFLNLIGDELFIGQHNAVFSGENFVRQSVSVRDGEQPDIRRQGRGKCAAT